MKVYRDLGSDTYHVEFSIQEFEDVPTLLLDQVGHLPFDSLRAGFLVYMRRLEEALKPPIKTIESRIEVARKKLEGVPE